MTERMAIYLGALLVITLALAAMAAAHQTHYRNRKWQLLTARIDALERIVTGEHD